jgi:hypothetical protein
VLLLWRPPSATRTRCQEPCTHWFPAPFQCPCPADEIWLNDSDIVLIPKSGIMVADNIISLLFTQGLYGIAPFSTATTFSVTKFGAL